MRAYLNPENSDFTGIAEYEKLPGVGENHAVNKNDPPNEKEEIRKKNDTRWSPERRTEERLLFGG